MSQAAQDRLAAGDTDGALKALQEAVRARADDVKLRVFLFQLLCIKGQWQRALTQLEVCGELDHGTLAMVSTYREAIKCELLRESVFVGRTKPIILGQPQAWIALLIEALQCDTNGLAQSAADMRARAMDEAKATPGTLNGEAFAWLADADPRLGPVLEVIVNGRYAWAPFSSLAKVQVEEPTDLRDMVWAAARLEFPNGGDAVALIPTRYVNTALRGDSQQQLSRSTEWLEAAPGQFIGIGQRLLATDAAEVGLLDVRQIAMSSLDA